MNDRDTFRELREKMDGSDPFMRGGHGIKKMRVYRKNVPAWVNDDKEVQKLLLRSFPKLKTNDNQRKRASIWLRVLHLYFRMGLSFTQVAGEMSTDALIINPKKVQNVVQAILYVSRGRQSNNRSMLGNRPQGRPKRVR